MTVYVNPLVPAFHGRYTPNAECRAFLARVARRVEAGFLMGQPHFRSRYAVVSQGLDELSIRSEGFWSDYNVGLNDISLRIERDGAIDYRVSYWRWLRGGIVLSALLVGVIIASQLLPLPKGMSYLAEVRDLPRSQQAAGLAIFWGSMAWWGLAWPWVLAMLHRRPAEQALRRILGEVDAADRPAAAA